MNSTLPQARQRPGFVRQPCLAFFLGLLVIGCPTRAQSNDDLKKISPRELTHHINRSDFEFHYGSWTVSPEQHIAANLAVASGSLDIQAGAVVEGEVWVVNGDIYLNGDARIVGKVHIVNGRLYASLEGTSNADVTLYQSESRLDADRYIDRGVVTFIRVRDPDRPHTKPTVALGPTTRVDAGKVRAGLRHGEADIHQSHSRWRFELHMPFTQNNGGWLGFDGALQVPLKEKRIELELEGYKKTVTNDDWQVPLMLNDQFVSVTNNDFHDYYQRRGGALRLKFHPVAFWSLAGGLFAHDDVSLRLKSTGSLFAGRRTLRENPPIDDGTTIGFIVAATYDTREDEAFPQNAWLASATLERGIGAFDGDFVYAALDLELNRYQRIVRGLTVDGHAKVFSAFDHAPRQTWQWLNGYGGVRGLHDIPFPTRRGDKLARISVEMRAALPNIPIVSYLLDQPRILMFGDMGIQANTGQAAGGGVFGFLNADRDSWGKSVGIGICGRSFIPYLEIAVAQDIDRNNKRPRFLIRTTRMF